MAPNQGDRANDPIGVQVDQDAREERLAQAILAVLVTRARELLYLESAEPEPGRPHPTEVQIDAFRLVCLGAQALAGDAGALEQVPGIAAHLAGATGPDVPGLQTYWIADRVEEALRAYELRDSDDACSKFLGLLAPYGLWLQLQMKFPQSRSLPDDLCLEDWMDRLTTAGIVASIVREARLPKSGPDYDETIDDVVQKTLDRISRALRRRRKSEWRTSRV